MSNITFDVRDSELQRLGDALAQYGRANPNARVDLIRENSAAIQIRVTDPQFAGLSKVERSNKVWPFIRLLPEELQDEISALVLLAPQDRLPFDVGEQFAPSQPTVS